MSAKEWIPRRRAARPIALVVVAVTAIAGCRGHQSARIKDPGEADRIGSHAAGAAVYDQLVEEGVAQFLGECAEREAIRGTNLGPEKKRICFVGVENRGYEELGTFKESMEQKISSAITTSRIFTPLNKRYVDAGLAESRLRIDQLLVPDNRRRFAVMMESAGQPFDYLVFADLVSTHTQSNRDYQRDYQLNLTMVDVNTGEDVYNTTVELSKDYNRTVRAKASSWWNPFG